MPFIKPCLWIALTNRIFPHFLPTKFTARPDKFSGSLHLCLRLLGTY